MLDQWLGVGSAVTRTGGKHFDGFNDIGFAQTVRTDQNVDSWYEIDHYLAPGAVVVECETGYVHRLIQLLKRIGTSR
jgi:hypothetical protein